MCQRPERASLISTIMATLQVRIENGCQRPERASLISTLAKEILGKTTICVNALNGLL